MLGILVLLANRAACFQAVDTRWIVLKYCERRAIFCNELSRRVGIRAKFGVNALSLNGLERAAPVFTSAMPMTTDRSVNASSTSV